MQYIRQLLTLLQRPPSLVVSFKYPQILTLLGDLVQILMNPAEAPRLRLRSQINSLASASVLLPEEPVLPIITTTLVDDLEAGRAPVTRSTSTADQTTMESRCCLRKAKSKMPSTREPSPRMMRSNSLHYTHTCPIFGPKSPACPRPVFHVVNTNTRRKYTPCFLSLDKFEFHQCEFLPKTTLVL